MTSPDITRRGTTQRWSDTTVWNGLLFLCEVPTQLDTDIRQQTAEVLSLLNDSLVAAGSSNRYLLNATIYVPDPNDLGGFNEVWDAWVPSGCAPVRACIHAQLTKPAMRVEIQAIAALIPS